MNTNATPTKKIDTKTLLSTLWIVVMINMLKADILSLFIPGALDEVAKTSVSTGAPIPQLMLGGAIMMEISIVMIVLSRVLKYKAQPLDQHHCEHHHDRVCVGRRGILSPLHLHRHG